MNKCQWHSPFSLAASVSRETSRQMTVLWIILDIDGFRDGILNESFGDGIDSMFLDWGPAFVTWWLNWEFEKLRMRVHDLVNQKSWHQILLCHCSTVYCHSAHSCWVTRRSPPQRSHSLHNLRKIYMQDHENQDPRSSPTSADSQLKRASFDKSHLFVKLYISLLCLVMYKDSFEH